MTNLEKFGYLLAAFFAIWGGIFFLLGTVRALFSSNIPDSKTILVGISITTLCFWATLLFFHALQEKQQEETK